MKTRNYTNINGIKRNQLTSKPRLRTCSKCDTIFYARCRSSKVICEKCKSKNSKR